MIRKLITTLLLSAALTLLMGCKGPVEQTTSVPTFPITDQVQQADETDVVEPTPSVENGPTEAASVSEVPETSTPEPSPTEDIRPLPEDWPTWPVIPTLSPSMIEVYQQGLAMGNRDNSFSKVGDCQIIPDAFLGLFDNPSYVLPERLADLQGTLDHFQGSFAREGYSLKGGFVFPTIFSPLRADSSVCNPGETPYECELRVHQPSFVLIAMEFRYEGRTAETHERYLRKTVEYALSRGIVPILMTKADNYEGDHSLNLTTAQIAYEYDLPLINYWSAVQFLPDKGIAWDRDAYGFHTTLDAWLIRSEVFLKALDALYHQAQGIQ
jgi:hypothetical protein